MHDRRNGPSHFHSICHKGKPKKGDRRRWGECSLTMPQRVCAKPGPRGAAQPRPEAIASPSNGQIQGKGYLVQSDTCPHRKHCAFCKVITPSDLPGLNGRIGPTPVSHRKQSGEVRTATVPRLHALAPLVCPMDSIDSSQQSSFGSRALAAWLLRRLPIHPTKFVTLQASWRTSRI